MIILLFFSFRVDRFVANRNEDTRYINYLTFIELKYIDSSISVYKLYHYPNLIFLTDNFAINI